MSPALVAIIKAIILPPGIFLVALILCLLVYFYKRRMFVYIFIASTVCLYILSTPIFSRNLASVIEKYDVVDIEQVNKNDNSVIVVLGCNRHPSAPEYSGKDIVSSCTLVRLRYAAYLSKISNLPVIVSGGSVFDESVSEAELMQDVLVNEFNTNVILIENISKNTLENAREVTRLIKEKSINRVVLVTHAIHMLRAVHSFNKFGVDVTPAPTYFYSTKGNKPGYLDYLPSIKSFYISSISLYELIGYVWIRIR